MPVTGADLALKKVLFLGTRPRAPYMWNPIPYTAETQTTMESDGNIDHPLITPSLHVRGYGSSASDPTAASVAGPIPRSK